MKQVCDLVWLSFSFGGLGLLGISIVSMLVCAGMLLSCLLLILISGSTNISWFFTFMWVVEENKCSF